MLRAAFSCEGQPASFCLGLLSSQPQLRLGFGACKQEQPVQEWRCCCWRAVQAQHCLVHHTGSKLMFAVVLISPMEQQNVGTSVGPQESDLSSWLPHSLHLLVSLSVAFILNYPMLRKQWVCVVAKRGTVIFILSGRKHIAKPPVVLILHCEGTALYRFWDVQWIYLSSLRRHSPPQPLTWLLPLLWH